VRQSTLRSAPRSPTLATRPGPCEAKLLVGVQPLLVLTRHLALITVRIGVLPRQLAPISAVERTQRGAGFYLHSMERTLSTHTAGEPAQQPGNAQGGGTLYWGTRSDRTRTARAAKPRRHIPSQHLVRPAGPPPGECPRSTTSQLKFLGGRI
jgi:hypothetical protein